MKNWLVGGMGVLTLLVSFFPFNIASAAEGDEPYSAYGPQPTDGIYLYFGRPEEPKDEPNGITITLDETSVSYQSILATVTMPVNLIEERDIERFYIMRNGQRIVDIFDPAYDNWEINYRRYYPITISVSDEYIGSIMEFQVAAVTRNSNGEEFVVAWSNITPAVQFKPLPVIDRTAVTLLEEILGKLSSMSEQLNQALQNLTKAVEAIYTPSPEAQQRLDRAAENFMNKLPMTEVQNEISELNESLERSKSRLQSPNQEKIELGGKFRLIPELAESEVAFLDLTEYKDFIKTFRTIMEAMLWVFFFQMLLTWITPKPEI